jgi:hypothetical protein
MPFLKGGAETGTGAPTQLQRLPPRGGEVLEATRKEHPPADLRAGCCIDAPNFAHPCHE